MFTVFIHLFNKGANLNLQGCKDSCSKENDRYLQIVSESMSGTTEEESKKNYTKIIKNIVKETVIDKTSE
jgi:hypothetical protein